MTHEKKVAKQAHPWTVRLLEILDGGTTLPGDWRDYQDILDEVAPLVPDDIAWKKAEWYREYHYKKSGKPVKPRRYGDSADTIKTGQRFIVAKSIQDLRRHGRVEVEYASDTAKRKKPLRIRRLV